MHLALKSPHVVDRALPVGGSGQAGMVKQPPRWGSCEIEQNRGDKETVMGGRERDLVSPREIIHKMQFQHLHAFSGRK